MDDLTEGWYVMIILRDLPTALLIVIKVYNNTIECDISP